MDNCWEAIVDTWLSEEYEQYHAVRSRCRAMMQGSSHKQGPTTLKEYAARYTRFHPGQECASFKAYALAHKGKAKDPDLVYNPEDPPEAYSNLSMHSRLSEYTAMAREIHGPEFDPSTADLEGDIVMRLNNQLMLDVVNGKNSLGGVAMTCACFGCHRLVIGWISVDAGKNGSTGI
ncbi:uncharacterized protein [Miscanthus floridulus]|uniref:uncharacterized protein n=1 Tax=Miscanthus floridulus TaxID=154761 RepID=UPI00345A91C7